MGGVAGGAPRDEHPQELGARGAPVSNHALGGTLVRPRSLLRGRRRRAFQCRRHSAIGARGWPGQIPLRKNHPHRHRCGGGIARGAARLLARSTRRTVPNGNGAGRISGRLVARTRSRGPSTRGLARTGRPTNRNGDATVPTAGCAGVSLTPVPKTGRRLATIPARPRLRGHSGRRNGSG